MANIRIAQQLTQGYNPDGTPGTVTTGVPGPPGPPPSDAQVLAAVSQYVSTHPVRATISSSTDELTDFGLGADGSAGTFVSIGSNKTLAGYVKADGTPQNVDLHLQAKGAGQVYLDSPLAGNLRMTGDIKKTQPGLLNIDATTITCFNSMAQNGPASRLQNLYAGSSYFGNGNQAWYVSDDWSQIVSKGSNASPNGGVAVLTAYNSGYGPIQASAFTVSSDRRLKSEIAELSGALEEVRTTPAYSYRMSGERRRGLIADEAPADVVRTDEHGYQLIESYDLVGTLWAAVRELADKIEGMERTCRCQPTA